MSQLITIICSLAMLFNFTACGPLNTLPQADPMPGTENSVLASGESGGQAETNADGMIDILLTVGTESFPAVLEDNETTRALMEQFPMTLNMGELNGNEKYQYMEEPLPVNQIRPGQIREGDLMLFGSDCVVLFYESFPSSYSYTRLGNVLDAAGLAEALGGGSVTVAFEQVSAEGAE